MAIDTKTTAGGIVVLLLSGGTSYAITSSQSKDIPEETDSQQQGRTNPKTPEKKTSIKEKIREFGFKLIDEQTDKDAQWTKLKVDVEKIKKDKYSGEKTVEELKKFCQTRLEEDYSSDSEDKLQEAFKKCTNLITFKERATSLNISLTEDVTPDTPWESKFTALTEAEVKRMAQESSATFNLVSGNVTKETLKEFCTKVSTLNWTNLEGTGVSIEKEWNNYLKGCTKDQNISKNFWTGK